MRVLRSLISWQAAIAASCLAISTARAETVVTPHAKPTAEQSAAIHRALRPEDRGLPYSVATADLNGDGRPDLIAQFNSSMYCGSAGCSGFALLATSRGFESHAIDLPNFQQTMTVLDKRHSGMHDLRFDDARYVFKWDGKAYR